MLAVLVDGNFLAVEVLHVPQFIEVSMRMAAKHEIDAACPGDELLVVGRKGADPGTYLGYGYDFYIESYKNNIKVAS